MDKNSCNKLILNEFNRLTARLCTDSARRAESKDIPDIYRSFFIKT